LLAISRRRYDDAAIVGAGIAAGTGGDVAEGKDGSALPAWAKVSACAATLVNDSANATMGTIKKRNMRNSSFENTRKAFIIEKAFIRWGTNIFCDEKSMAVLALQPLSLLIMALLWQEKEF
jgi:hypothetical protein